MCYGKILSNQVQKARKMHRCWQCRKWIMPGKLYERSATKRDGVIETLNTCELCRASTEPSNAADYDGCYYQGDVTDGIRERARRRKR